MQAIVQKSKSSLVENLSKMISDRSDRYLRPILHLKSFLSIMTRFCLATGSGSVRPSSFESIPA